MANDPRTELECLAEAMAKDILELPDEEALRQVGGAEGLKEAHAAITADLEAAMAASRKKKLADARLELEAFNAKAGKDRRVVDLDEARKRLKRALLPSQSDSSRITLAARDGKGIPDTDIEGLA
ncbi:MAG TPA: hypothetical protein VFV47_01170, partial [Hyphomicrobiaceae bacterium]|nr:hypothetical protein [Hyphomicrobiaceae bacterium]